jgi:hypothetical protein
MTTATMPSPTAERAPAALPRPARTPDGRPAGDFSAIRAFLSHYTGTLLPLTAALIALHFGWHLLAGRAAAAGQSWPLAVTAACGWALAVAAWLVRRGTTTATLVTVVAGPALVLAAPAAAGWLSPAGLLLWGPVSTVLAVALALAAQPLPLAAPRQPNRPPAPDHGRPTHLREH